MTLAHVTTALSPTWQWSLAIKSELTNVLPSQMPTPNVMHNITFGRNSAYRKHHIHIHLTSQSTEDRTRQWQFTNDLVFPIEFTLWLLRPSEGANPRTRSRYEKNYLRFLVLFFKYSWDKQLSNLLHLRASFSDIWKCHTVNPRIAFIFPVTNKFRNGLSLVHKYPVYNRYLF